MDMRGDSGRFLSEPVLVKEQALAAVLLVEQESVEAADSDEVLRDKGGC